MFLESMTALMKNAFTKTKRQLFYEGKTQKREHQLRCSFFVPSPLLSCEPVFFRKLGALICVTNVTQIWWMCKLCLQAYIIQFYARIHYLILLPKALRRKFIHGPTGGGQNTKYVSEFVSLGLGALVAQQPGESKSQTLLCLCTN